MGSKVRGGGREVKRPAKWVPRSFAFFAKGRVPRRLAPAKLGAVTTMQADGHDKPMVQTASYPPLPRTQERGTLCSGAGREQHGRAGHPPRCRRHWSRNQRLICTFGRPLEKERVAELPVLSCWPSETDTSPLALKTIAFLSQTTSNARSVYRSAVTVTGRLNGMGGSGM